MVSGSLHIDHDNYSTAGRTFISISKSKRSHVKIIEKKHNSNHGGALMRKRLNHTWKYSCKSPFSFVKNMRCGIKRVILFDRKMHMLI